MIVRVNEIWSGETAERAADGPREYTRIFRVVTDDPSHRMHEILWDHRIPQIFADKYPDDPEAICVKTTASRVDATRLVWIVNADYTTWHPGDENPLARPAKIVFKSQQYTKPVLTDIEDRPIVNVLGDAIPGVEIDDTRWVIEITKNVSPRLPRWILTYNNAINDGPVRIAGLEFPKYTLKLQELQIPFDIKRGGPDGDIEYIEISFSLHYRRETWLVDVANQGFHHHRVVLRRPQSNWTGNQTATAGTLLSVNKEPILLGDPPSKTSEPQWLDENGFLIESLEDTEPVILEPPLEPKPLDNVDEKGNPVVREKKPHFIRYHVYREKDFSVLPLS